MKSLQSKLDAYKARKDVRPVAEPPKVPENGSKKKNEVKAHDQLTLFDEKSKSLHAKFDEKSKSTQAMLDQYFAGRNAKPAKMPEKITENGKKKQNEVKAHDQPTSMDDKLNSMQAMLDKYFTGRDDKPAKEPHQITENGNKKMNEVKTHDQPTSMDDKLNSIQAMLDKYFAGRDAKPAKEPHQITENGNKKMNEVKGHNQQLSFNDELKSAQSKLDVCYAERDVKPVAEPAKPIRASSNHLGHMDKVTKMEEEVDERIRLQMKAHRQKTEQFAKSLEDKKLPEKADDKEKMRLKLEKDKEKIREIYRMETCKILDATKNQHVHHQIPHQIPENKKINEVKDHNQQLLFDDELKSTRSKLDTYYAERDVKPVAEPAKPISASSNQLGHMDKVTKMEEEVDERIRLQMKADRQEIEQFAKSLEDKKLPEKADEKEKMRLKLEKDKEKIREIYRMETSKFVDAMKNQHVQQLETFKKKTQENLAEMKNSTLQIQKENKDKALATSSPGMAGIKPSELGKEKNKTEIKIENFRPTCLRIKAQVEEQKETAKKLEFDLEKTKYNLNDLETKVELLQRRYKQLPTTLTNVKEFNTKVPDLKRGDKVTNIPIASNYSIPRESAQKYSQRSSALSSTQLPKTSSTNSLDALLKEKWKKYFPSGISPLNAYAQKTGNEFGYVSAEEQVAMLRRARVTEKYTDPRSITSIIEDNKRWLRKF
ncbi:hypothetical protein XELAEV_18047635mg [Xenopus laevis]|uniref:Uncharacterized protein n=1 Tax=Xenopus laevis TaxID=8355 RepID=A0A974H1Q6_XENLA|nr:hypothetical protein XELAEV_18047635mg [Xenopus laevis]